MKYLRMMVALWANMLVGRNKTALAGIIMLALYQSIYAGMSLGWLGAVASVCAWVFVLPAAIYCIDYRTRQFPSEPKTLGNLWRSFFSKS